jgi:hypothetical protein
LIITLTGPCFPIASTGISPCHRYNEAATKGRKAIALDRSRWQGYYITATAYAGLNQCDAAVPYFQSALDHGLPEQIKTAIAGAVGACERLLKDKGILPSPPDPNVPPSQSAAPTDHIRRKPETAWSACSPSKTVRGAPPRYLWSHVCWRSAGWDGSPDGRVGRLFR